MAEAKARRISHFKSEIFNEGPPPTQKRFHSANPKKQESSQIFTPHQHVPKPLSQSRERSYKNSDIFQATKEQAALALDVSKHTDNTSMKVAGKKEKVYKMDWATRNDSHYYRRSVDKNIKILDFQPKYAEQTVQERKEKEFFGGFHPIHKIKEPRAENSEKTARELKKLQMRSIFDKPINNENIPPQSLNTQKDYKPSQRKFEILASAVFEDKPINEYPNSYKKEVYDEKRHKNHLYSDLLDTSYEFPQKSKKSDLQSSSQTWLLHSTKVNNISYNPKDHIFDNFKSNIDQIEKPKRNRSVEVIPMCPLNSETISKIKPTFSPKKIKVNELRASMQTPQEYSNTSPTILNLQLSGLGKDCSNLDIRQLCEGFHIISPELENDTLTGQCKGKASLSLRCNDSKAYKDFQIKMLSKGIQIEKKENTQVLKSNYWQISNVPLKEFRNSRTPNPDVDARTAKVNEQLSSVFGRPRRFTPVRLERDRNFQAQLQWKKTKSTKKDML